MSDPIYYFGKAHQGSGHHFYNPRLVNLDYHNPNWPSDMPWGNLDGALLPRNTKEVQSQYVIHHSSGWVAMAFWDRTGDRRPGSNSAFMARGDLDVWGIVKLAEVNFPSIMRRLSEFKFSEWKYEHGK